MYPDSHVRLEATSPVLFLSDLHFGDGSKTDLFGDQDERLMEFIEEKRRQVETIVFLGDIVDMPQAWTAKRVARAHPVLMGYLRDLTAKQRVIFVLGNHDWLVDYESMFVGSTCVQAVLIGERTLAWHGHQMDMHMHPGIENATLKTYVHAAAERLVGCRLLPPLERYDSMPNRIALSLAVAWSRLLITGADIQRVFGRTASAEEVEATVRYFARSVCGDPADIFGATSNTVLGHEVDAVLCGHSHVPGVVKTPRGVFANTGTWARGMRTYALWTGQQFAVHNVDTGERIRDEHYASVPAETAPSDLFDWWMEQWRQGRLTSPLP